MTRTPGSKRAKPNGGAATNAGAPQKSPQAHRKQAQSTSNGAKHFGYPVQSPAPTTLASVTPHKLPPTMAMSADARLVWNLKILKRHDPCITRIFDQAPYAVLYTFNHTHALDPDGGKGKKYEGTWEKSGIEGTVFIVERSVAPHYGFFLLNRGGTASVIQVFHQDDMIELGADPKFLTFRPGIWDRATTPYTEPFTRCTKPELICLWLSDESAGPRFAYFMTKAKEYLAREAREEAGGATGTSPPLTPLSQVRYHSDADSSSEVDDHEAEEQSFRRQQAAFYSTDPSAASASSTSSTAPPPATADPLDMLFASLANPAAPGSGPITETEIETTTTTTTTHTTVHSINATPTANFPLQLFPAHNESPAPPPIPTSAPPRNAENLLHSILPNHSPAPTSAFSPPPVPPPTRSLLDDIFASAARGSDTPPSGPPFGDTQPDLGSLGAAFVLPPQNTAPESAPHPHHEPAPATPPTTSFNTASAAQRFTHGLSASEDDDDEDDDVVLVHAGGRSTSASAASASVSASASRTDRSSDDFQELEAPSPSLIPNPMHTPMPASLPRGSKARNRNRNMLGPRVRGGPQHAHTGSIGQGNGPIPFPLPAVRGGRANGSHRMEQYIPQNTNEETKVDTEALTTAMLDAHLAQSNGEPRPTLSKYDFVSEVLTLIHKDTAFGDDLYARYLALAKDRNS